ncbi:SAF domain-containing protein [Streptomyces armeniacus]|uniref:SAF domain-containing protein n=1 Tax=Streptomyces armeniacus TaxID=83291 RepID=UPI001FE62389|nr:SAF domain-containing protein [Streptomyces armeniacus]
MLVSAVGFTWVVSTVGERQEVLILARDVAAGQVLTTKDLRSVKVASDVGVIPVESRGEALGERARVPLVAGALLSPRMIGRSAVFPPQGKSQVTFAVEAGAGPSDLARGDRVAVLPGPDGQAVATEEEQGQEPESSVVGTVTGVRSPQSAGGVREVRVLVDTAAVRTATDIQHPRVVVLPAQGREAP